MDVSQDFICQTCALVSQGYSGEELGLGPDFSTPAVHYNINVLRDESRFGSCDFCSERSEVYMAESVPFETAG